jgi:hypothetical protein
MNMNKVLSYHVQIWVKPSSTSQPITWIREHQEYLQQHEFAHVYADIIQWFCYDANPRLIYIPIR